MELFVREIVKASLWLICAGGAALMALGIVFLFWPEFVWFIAACSFVFAGAFLCGRTAYAIIKTTLTRN